MKGIIFNADDFGLSKGVNEGIVHCYENGVVNSSSLMVNTRHFDDTVALIKTRKLPGIGLHFNLTEGKPITVGLRNLTDKEGRFYINIVEKKFVNTNEIMTELEAQYNKAIKAGIDIKHLDSHHHVHTHGRFIAVFLAFARKHKLPIRKINCRLINPLKIMNFYWKTRNADYYTKAFASDFYDSNVSEKTIKNILDRYRYKNVEIMCHPGYNDIENGIYNKQRESEIDILTGIVTKKMVQ